MTPTEKVRTRTVRNQIRLIREHLEAMQRDAHGLEYSEWKREVDGLWKLTFAQIGQMRPELQQSVLEMIKELWTIYLTHYAVET